MEIWPLDRGGANLRSRLAGSNFAALRFEFAPQEAAAIFQTLFPVAVEYTGDGADHVAARLLVDLEPACPVSCRDALLMVADGEYQLSERLVPFYLVVQFGKRKLLRTADELVAEPGLGGSQETAINTIAYWARVPAVRLLRPFIPWQGDPV